VEKKPKKTWTAPKPKPKPVIADPEVALPEDPPSGETAPAEKKPSSASDGSEPDAEKKAWETSPSPGF
jgi:hypothetical protein